MPHPVDGDAKGSTASLQHHFDPGGSLYEDLGEATEGLSAPTVSQLRVEAFRRRARALGRFLSSHLGLLTVVVAYSVAGGILFQQLEATNEKNECLNAEILYKQLENSFVSALWQVTHSTTETAMGRTGHGSNG